MLCYVVARCPELLDSGSYLDNSSWVLALVPPGPQSSPALQPSTSTSAASRTSSSSISGVVTAALRALTVGSAGVGAGRPGSGSSPISHDGSPSGAALGAAAGGGDAAGPPMLLQPDQAEAVLDGLRPGCCVQLIQGPPGTGETLCCAVLRKACCEVCRLKDIMHHRRVRTDARLSFFNNQPRT